MVDFYAHPDSLVESQQIGAGTRIWAFTHIMPNVVIGINCNIGDHCYIESGAIIGNCVTIKNGNMIWDGVALDDGVFVGPHVFFTNDLYPRSPRLPQAHGRYSNHEWLVPTFVKKGASLGAGAVILAGVIIGEYATVGAGAVVTRSVPAHALVVGNPARTRGWVCQCGQPLAFQREHANCSSCGLEFIKEDDLVGLFKDRNANKDLPRKVGGV